MPAAALLKAGGAFVPSGNNFWRVLLGDSHPHLGLLESASSLVHTGDPCTPSRVFRLGEQGESVTKIKDRLGGPGQNQPGKKEEDLFQET